MLRRIEMKKIIVFILALTLVMPCTAAFADDFSAVYDSTNEGIKYSGNFSGRQTVKLFIMPESMKPEDLSDDVINGAEPVYLLVEEIGADGSLIGNVSFEESIFGKRYMVYAQGESFEGGSIILPAEKAALIQSAEDINNSNWTKFKNELPMDKSILDLYEDKVKSLLYSPRPSGGYTAETLLKTYTLIDGLVRWNEEEISLQEFLIKYNGYTGISYDADFVEQDEAVKNLLDGLLRGFDFHKNTFPYIYKDALMTAKCRTAALYSNLKSIAEEYFEENDITVEAYDSLSSEALKLKAYEELYKKKSTFTSAEDISKKLETIAESILNERKNAIDGGTGGGSTGGTGGGARTGIGVGGNNSIIGAGNQNPEQNITTATDLTDIAGHWAEKYIEEMYSNKYISGYTDNSFKPDNGVTRAEFVKIIVAMFGYTASFDGSFSDVHMNEWYAPYIGGAVKAGWVNGVSDGSFMPDGMITRQDAAAIVYRMAVSKGLSVTDTAQDVDFSDWNIVDNHAQAAVAALSKQGVINGNNGAFLPKDNITRAEAAVMCFRAMNIFR